MGKIVDIKHLIKIRNNCKRQKKRVVFTNGVFDIIHPGHIEYLTNAKKMGNVLIVGVNSDKSVRRIKGPKRPIIPEKDRAFVVANLLPVDYVCIFNEDTPYNLISKIIPDVLVKGADWKTENIIGKDIVEKSGGIVKNIRLTPRKSTTSIINHILKRFSGQRKIGK